MSSTPPELELIIKAVDEATAPLRAVVAAMEGMQHAAKAAGHAAEHAAKESHSAFGALRERIAGINEHLKATGERVGGLREGLVEFFPMLAGFGTIGAAGGVFEFTEKVAEARAEFMATAKVIGITTAQLGALNMSAKMTDVDVQTMQGGLTKLNKAIATAAAGKNKDAAALFHHLGIEAKGADGHLKTVAELMPELAEAFAKTADPAMRTRMAMTLFGKSGAEMLPMLMEGKEGLTKWAEASKRLNYAFTPEDNEHLEEFHQSWVQLGVAVSGFANEAGAKLAPVLLPIVEGMTHWVAANRDWIATDVAGHVKDFVSWLEKIHWDDYAQDARKFFDGLGINAAQLEKIKDIIDIAMAAWVGVVALRVREMTAAMMANPVTAAIVIGTVAGVEGYRHRAEITQAVKQTGVLLLGGETGMPVPPEAPEAAAASPGGAPAPPNGPASGFAAPQGRNPGREAHEEGAAPEMPDDSPGAGTAPQNDRTGGPRRVASPPPAGIGPADGWPTFFHPNAWFQSLFGAPRPAPILLPAQTPPEPPSPYAAPPPSVYGQPAPQASAQPAGGSVEVTVRFDNAPPGMTTQTAASGSVAIPQVDVGYAQPGVGHGDYVR